MMYTIDDLNKEHLIKYISEYDELVQKIKNQKLRFGEIENCIKEYNIWAKKKNN